MSAHPLVVLTGMPGVGKSTVGRLVAERMNVAFADTDARLEQVAGHSVADIYTAIGEQAFRAMETAEVLQALSSFGGVLALGGGVVVSRPARCALIASGAHIVYLHASVETLLVRLSCSHERPILAGDAKTRLAHLISLRESLYRSVSTVTIETDRSKPSEILTRVTELITATSTERGDASYERSRDNAG